MYNPTLL